MQVKVKQDCKGFLGGKLRKQGESFELGDNKFSDTWMIKTEEKAKPAAKKTQKRSD